MRGGIVSILFLYATHAATMQLQEPLHKVNRPKRTALLSIINNWHWLYTTEIGVGNPQVHFRAVIETASSDIFVPSANCTDPVDRDKYPVYNSSESSTYIPDGRPVRVGNGIYRTWGNASIDSYHVGGIEVEHQTFEEAIDIRPGFPDIWHESALALSREIVYSYDESNLHAMSPFQNMVKQGVLEDDLFSLRLPRKVHETGFLLLGARGDDYDAQSAIQLPLLENPGGSKRNNELYYLSGGWEVEPVYLHFGTGEDEIYYDLYGYSAAFTTWPPFLVFPETFVNWVLKHIGAFPGDTVMYCKDVTAALPNITVALRGIGGSVEEFVLTYEDYAMDIWRLFLKDDECQLPFVTQRDNPDGPRYILLGPQFIRRHYTTFDEGRKSIFCEYYNLPSLGYLD